MVVVSIGIGIVVNIVVVVIVIVLIVAFIVLVTVTMISSVRALMLHRHGCGSDVNRESQMGRIIPHRPLSPS